MQTPAQISFRNLREPDEAIRSLVDQSVAGLERLFPRITGCSVMIEAPRQHRHSGGHFHVRVDLSVPDAELVTDRDPPLHHSHAELATAIREAFRAARRRLMDHVRLKRWKARTHAASLQDLLPASR